MFESDRLSQPPEGEMPVVALALPSATAGMMFDQTDLDRLRCVANVVGPVSRAGVEDLRPLLRCARAAITGWGSRLDDLSLFEQAPQLGLIAHSAGSIRGLIPLDLVRRGVKVTSAASANAVPVAEFTVAAMTMLLKQVPWLGGGFALSRAERDARFSVIRELQDISVGIIGASRIGREVIRLLKSYTGLRVRLFDPYVSTEEARALGVELVSLDELCRCEVVSVHAPNVPETRHMINARTLSLLPDHAIFINTSRGALVDEAALVEEVRRRPLYCLLDVTDPEPPPLDSPLRSERNIILTPHIAGAMNQARRRMGRLAIDEVIRFLAGEPLQHEIRPEMLATMA
jgi:phosphoglycerate dehydrogenase-like enzyme